MARDGLRIDLRYDQRHLRVHAERAGVVDDDGTSLHGCRRKLLAGCTAREQGDFDVLEGVVRRLLNGVILAHEGNDLACGTL